MTLLNIYAGEKAYCQIKRYGLSPNQIFGIFGASGAAKWLGIYGLDQVIYSEWLTHSNHPIHLYGTSVGAWKFAAAAQSNPGDALDRFAQAYIEQSYPDGFSHEAISRGTDTILEKYLPQGAVTEILNHSFLRFHCGVVKSKGWLASESKPLIAAAMGQAMIRNAAHPKALGKSFERVIFSDARDKLPLHSDIKDNTSVCPLDDSNFYQAIRASGSIPYVMPSVGHIKGAPNGVYRDGGLIDYHPTPGRIWGGDGLVLYPHFYDHVIPGWFDKPLRSRRATPDLLSKTVLICPSKAFVETLPNKKLPDRHDFNRYKGHDAQRVGVWREAAARSEALGQEFMALYKKDGLAGSVQPLPSAQLGKIDSAQ